MLGAKQVGLGVALLLALMVRVILPRFLMAFSSGAAQLQPEGDPNFQYKNLLNRESKLSLEILLIVYRGGAERHVAQHMHLCLNID